MPPTKPVATIFSPHVATAREALSPLPPALSMQVSTRMTVPRSSGQASWYALSMEVLSVTVAIMGLSFSWAVLRGNLIALRPSLTAGALVARTFDFLRL